ncbi:MAG: CPBP family intramembrane glutamic endopeptidase [Methanomassiliicoccus sp.]|nr:CPBP family intramembrane glutamic endopeptidase [Methanomassiliicoccus sp.]
MSDQGVKVLTRVANSEFAFVLSVAQLVALIPLRIYLPDLDWNVAITYMLIPVLLTYYGKRLPDLIRGVRLVDIMWYGTIAFTLTTVVTLYLFRVVLGTTLGTLNPLEATSVIATQVLFVAPSEELAFRFAVPSWLRMKFPRSWKFTPMLIASATFALFHYTAYAGSWTSILIAFIIGLIWALAYSRWGLGATIGSHCAYNLVVAGMWSLIGGL